jgi:hypothetical protein
MACSPFAFAGITLDCGNVGGIKTIYIADVLDVTTVTETGGAVSAITMVASKKFKKFEFRKGNANFVSTSTRNDQAGTNFVTTVTTAEFNFMETVKRNEMQGLVTANTYLIVTDNNGKNWFIGKESYNGGGVNGESGAGMGDANKYSVTLTSETPTLPLEVTDVILNGIR